MENYIKKLESLLEQERTSRQIYAELNNFNNLKDTLTRVVHLLEKFTGCEAKGIRLNNNNDFPYYVSHGFSPSFIQKENTLHCRDKRGYKNSVKETNEYQLNCMCGNIIRGLFDPTLPFFTKGGSFWTNCNSALLAATTEKDRQVRTRNYCYEAGYESVALIPIKFKDENIGLIQLNDKRTGMFSESLIAQLELVARQVSQTIYNNLTYTRPKERQDMTRHLTTVCSCCKDIRNENGYWLPLEKYFGERLETFFTHSVCPKCEENFYPDLFVNH